MEETEPSSGQFNWYCGVNATETLNDFAWDLHHTLYNACFTDYLYALPHLIFVILGILVMLILGCCTKLRKRKHPYLIQFPGHNTRWVFNFVFISLTLCELGESILTNVDVYHDMPSQPHLYVPAIMSLAAALLSMIYYNQMELWSKPHMMWLLLLYWMAALGVEIVRFINLNHDIDVDATLLRFDLSIAAIVMYSFYLILEVCVIMMKVNTFWFSYNF